MAEQGGDTKKIENEAVPPPPLPPPSDTERIILAIEEGFRRVAPPALPVAADTTPLLETHQPKIEAARTAVGIGAFLATSASALAFILVNFFEDKDVLTLVALALFYYLMVGAMGYSLFRCTRRGNP